MNKELALMLSKEVLRIKEESNGTMTINEALESIVKSYKDSQLLNKKNNKINYILNQNLNKYNIGDKYLNPLNGMIGTIIKIKNKKILFSQYNPFYEFDYQNKIIDIKTVDTLIESGLLIKVEEWLWWTQ